MLHNGYSVHPSIMDDVEAYFEDESAALIDDSSGPNFDLLLHKTICCDDSPSCPMWCRIRKEAKDMAEAEPLLGGFVHSTILNHLTLHEALTFELANKLGTPSGMQPMQVGEATLSDSFFVRRFVKQRFGPAHRAHGGLCMLTSAHRYSDAGPTSSPDQQTT